MTARQELHYFICNNFRNLKLKKPLFYNWKHGLRFDLQEGETGSEKYFGEVNRRANAIFNSVFSDSDDMLAVVAEYKFRKRKIRFSNFIFRQITNLKRTEISFSKFTRVYGNHDAYNIAVIKLNRRRVNIRNTLAAIANCDYPGREPSYGFSSNEMVYFINLDKKLIFHMYDDRGLDLVAADLVTLKPVYDAFRDWLLDYDRKDIDGKFRK